MGISLIYLARVQLVCSRNVVAFPPLPPKPTCRSPRRAQRVCCCLAVRCYHQAPSLLLQRKPPNLTIKPNKLENHHLGSFKLKSCLTCLNRAELKVIQDHWPWERQETNRQRSQYFLPITLSKAPLSPRDLSHIKKHEGKWPGILAKGQSSEEYFLCKILGSSNHYSTPFHSGTQPPVLWVLWLDLGRKGPRGTMLRTLAEPCHRCPGRQSPYPAEGSQDTRWDPAERVWGDETQWEEHSYYSFSCSTMLG